MSSRAGSSDRDAHAAAQGQRPPAHDRESQRRVYRAVQTAREAAVCDPGLSEIKLRRFHRAMDDLLPGEGEQVYDILRDEQWYELAAQALARSK